MRMFTYMIAALLIAVAPASAQEKTQDGHPLPRALIIGDSVYSNHTRELSTELKGEVEVVYAHWNPREIADTTSTIELLDRHLGRIDRSGEPVARDKWPRWDLIHFNCGLGDLVHRAPGMKQFRVMPIHVGGIRNTPKEQYVENLDTLVTQLKARAPEARLIWASTTPIRASTSNVFQMGSEIEYNAAAAKVMAGHDIQVNDMYSYAKSIMNMDKPAGFGADPFHFDKQPLHPPIVEAIRSALKERSATVQN